MAVNSYKLFFVTQYLYPKITFSCTFNFDKSLEIIEGIIILLINASPLKTYCFLNIIMIKIRSSKSTIVIVPFPNPVLSVIILLKLYVQQLFLSYSPQFVYIQLKMDKRLVLLNSHQA